MDDADRAEEKIENTISAGIEDARYHLVNRELTPCGACHWCGEYVRGSQLFCDNECASDHAKMKGRYK